MSGKGGAGAKPNEKGGAKAGSAKSNSSTPNKPGTAPKGGAKSTSASASSSGSGKPSSSNSGKPTSSKPPSKPNQPHPNSGKPKSGAKKPHKPSYEAPVSSSSKKQSDSYELYGEDVSVEVMRTNSRQQARGRAPRTKKVSSARPAPTRRTTVGLSGALQDRLVSLLKSSPWSNVSSMATSTDPSLEENIAYLVNELGFRRFEVLQALQYAKNHYDIALEWLVINVPNDHLPLGFRSSAASAKVELMDISSQSHLRRRAVRKLTSYGFLESQCQRELEASNGDETRALFNLLESFLTRDAISTMRQVRKTNELNEQLLDQLKTEREDEFGMLQSILGDEGEVVRISDSLMKATIPITLRFVNNETKKISLNLEIHYPPENQYPQELPLMGLTCEDLKDEVLYAFTRQLMVEANQYAGQQLIYPLIMWIHSTAPRTLSSLSKTFDDPEKCKEAHGKYFKTLREDEMEKQALKQVKKDIRDAVSHAPSTESPIEVESADDSALYEGVRLLNLEVRDEVPPEKPLTELERSRIKEKSKDLLTKYQENRTSNDKFRQMLTARSSLPAYQNRLKILELLHGASGNVVLISGATGCGKTTQVAQIILDDMIERGIGGECNIICTQPRRLSAVSVAERVAEERCESIGQSVGYSIRLEAQRSEETQVLFVTTGILLRRLQNDPLLSRVSHVIVDEVHERDLNSDFLLIVLKQVLEKRNDLKLVLMSATLNAESFSRYFANCPSLEIPGRTFPVKQYYLEDAIEATGYRLDPRSPYATGGRKYKQYEGYSVNVSNVMAILNRKKINYELIAQLVDHIFSKFDSERHSASSSNSRSNDEGGILIFMPGMVEISTMIEQLQSSSYARRMTLLPLHSTLSTEQQQRIFKKPAAGTRKVVVSTNIAETSVTVDDVVFVIDSCRVKETRYDGHVESLVEDWTSKASIRQRMGRAGRVRAGICYSLISTARNVHLPEFQDPEMLRVPLDSLILQIRVLRLGNPRAFLQLALDPPTELAINNAIKELQDLNALNEDEHLTPLGYHLGKLPVSPKIGKMLIYGAVFQCLSPILTICAALSDKTPFVSSFENRDDAEDCKLSWDKDDEYSDHLTIVRAYEAWEDVINSKKGSDNAFCRENYLSKPTLLNMRDLRKQFRQILKDSGFVHHRANKPLKPSPSIDSSAKVGQLSGIGDDDTNSEEVKIIKAVLCAGLYPNLAHLRPNYDSSGSITSTNIVTKDGEIVSIHPSSVLAKTKRFPANFLVFHDRVKTSRIFLRDVTAISTYAALLFGGNIQIYPEDQMIEIDDWVPFHTTGREGVLLSKLRQEIDKLLLAKVAEPSLDISTKAIISFVVNLLKTETELTTH